MADSLTKNGLQPSIRLGWDISETLTDCLYKENNTRGLCIVHLKETFLLSRVFSISSMRGDRYKKSGKKASKSDQKGHWHLAEVQE